MAIIINSTMETPNSAPRASKGAVLACPLTGSWFSGGGTGTLISSGEKMAFGEQEGVTVVVTVHWVGAIVATLVGCTWT